jgi:hemerythrin-like domain-containing protein
MDRSRRDLVLASALLVPARLLASPAKKPAAKEEEDISPTEDLMREHGVLDRLLLVYEECAHRLDTHATVPNDAIGSAAGLIKRFIEDYHEQNEEQFLFLRMETGPHAELVKTLRDQHAAGRRVTNEIFRLAKDPRAVAPIRQFVRMYRPHAAREDTVLFPAFHDMLSEKERDQLGDQFEDKEHSLFGPKGFEHIVDEVAGLERALGIENLQQFTPKSASDDQHR